MVIKIGNQILQCQSCGYDLRDSMTKGIYCPNMQCENNPYYGKANK